MANIFQRLLGGAAQTAVKAVAPRPALSIAPDHHITAQKIDTMRPLKGTYSSPQKPFEVPTGNKGF